MSFLPQKERVVRRGGFMKAICLTGPNQFLLEERENPVPKRNEVLIQVRMAGICGSDVSLLRGKNPFASYPVVPGHEFMGEVLRAPIQSGLKKHDKVTVFPGVGCGKCPACREGREVHCPQFKFVGTSLPGGGFCERVVADYRRVFRLPKSMEDEVGAMVEPTAVAVHANRRAGTGKQSKIVIIGGGPIGLLTAQVARTCGACKIVLSEPIASRRKIAKTLDFRAVCNPREEDLTSFVQENMGSPDVVFDIVGTKQTVEESLSMLQPDGRLIPLALPHSKEMGISHHAIFAKELRVIGSKTYFREDFSEAIRLLRSKKVHVKPLISEILPLKKFADAVDHLEQEPERYVKVLIQPTPLTSDSP